MENKGFVIITGACGGIGKALTNAFSENGYQVIATDKHVEPQLGMSYSHYLCADLERTVDDEIYAVELFNEIKLLCHGQPINCLVNNAATQILGGVDSLTRADWKATLNVNLVAPFIWSQALINELEQAKGSIINISSIHTKLTKKNFVAYATSKSALSGMTRALAIDVGDRVRVNAIEPAAIETDMLVAGFKDSPDKYIELKNCHPMARVGRTEEVARLAVFLASNSVGFTHGSCISVDGGIGGRLFDPV